MTTRLGSGLPKLIATDLDGTLLRSDRSISPRTRAALKACSAAGVGVVLVTARPHRTVPDLARQIGCASTAICANGAAVLDVASGVAELVHAFTVREALAIVAALRPVLTGATAFALETGGEVFCEPGFRRGLVSGDNGAVVRDLAGARPTGGRYVKVLARDDAADADAMVAAARAVLGDRAESSRAARRRREHSPGTARAST